MLKLSTASWEMQTDQREQGSRFTYAGIQRACARVIPSESRSSRVGLLRETTLGLKKKKKETRSEISSILQMQTSLSRTPSHSAPAVCNGCASGKVIFSGWAHLLQCFENKYKNALFIFFPSHPTGAAEQKELEEPAACLRTLQQSGSSLTRDLERACFGSRGSCSARLGSARPALRCSAALTLSSGAEEAVWRGRTVVSTSRSADEGWLWNYCGIKLLWRRNAVRLTESCFLSILI